MSSSVNFPATTHNQVFIARGLRNNEEMNPPSSVCNEVLSVIHTPEEVLLLNLELTDCFKERNVEQIALNQSVFSEQDFASLKEFEDSITALNLSNPLNMFIDEPELDIDAVKVSCIMDILSDDEKCVAYLDKIADDIAKDDISPSNNIFLILDGLRLIEKHKYKYVKTPEEMLKEMQDVAFKDADKLKELGVTAKEIHEQFTKIIEEAYRIHKEQGTAENTFFLEEDGERFRKMGPINVLDDKYSILSKFGLEIITSCFICGQVEKNCNVEPTFQVYVATHTITNLTNGKTLKISEKQLHIMSHDYFGKNEKCRVDPLEVCEVLGLLKV